MVPEVTSHKGKKARTQIQSLTNSSVTALDPFSRFSVTTPLPPPIGLYPVENVTPPSYDRLKASTIGPLLSCKYQLAFYQSGRVSVTGGPCPAAPFEARSAKSFGFSGHRG
jgi:hypothetical protein